jgi:D-alanyl-lipoteichoic acid acyltransferase DltB (MBOAT superfamily)
VTITSLAFAVFCISAVVVHWLLPRRFRAGFLLFCSLIFTISWSWELTGILLVVEFANYFLGRWLESAIGRRKILLIAGISFNFLALATLKYSDFYVPALTRLFEKIGIGTGPGGLQVIVPVGLSFITLQMISYLVDISKGQVPAEKRWVEFSLYGLYFPKYLSGPIERAKAFIHKVDSPAILNLDQIGKALGLIFVGLIRKRLLADTLNAMIPADAFTHPLNYSATILLTWLLAYAFALYNDFAGYTSIVRGVSCLFGIELSSNFNVPYLARNFSEFWGRWHITLSNWLRDYIFFPVSRWLRKIIPNREGWVHFVIPPVITMLVSGLWHGASWNLLLWGGMHGGYLALEQLFKRKKPAIPADDLPKFRQFIGTLIVFIGVVLAWIPFRMDLVTAKRFLAGLVLPSHWAAPDWLWLHEVLVGHLPPDNVYGWNIPDPRIILVLVLAILLDLAHNKNKNELFFRTWPRWAQVTISVLAGLGILMLAFSDTTAPFIYTGF